MCAEAIVEISNNGATVPTERQIKSTYLKRWDRKYGATYAVLDILQRIFYRNDAAREAFVEMCDDKDVQKLTFDSYLYKRVVMMNPWQQIKLTMRTLGSLLEVRHWHPLITVRFLPRWDVPTVISSPMRPPRPSKPRRRTRKPPESAGPQSPSIACNGWNLQIPAVCCQDWIRSNRASWDAWLRKTASRFRRLTRSAGSSAITMTLSSPSKKASRAGVASTRASARAL